MVLPKRANGEVGHGPTAPFRSHGLSISKSGVVKMCTEIPRQQGFTLIEMIGVLAVHRDPCRLGLTQGVRCHGRIEGQRLGGGVENL